MPWSIATWQAALSEDDVIYKKIQPSAVQWWRNLQIARMGWVAIGIGMGIIILAGILAFPVRRWVLAKWGPRPEMDAPSYGHRIIAAVASTIALILLPTLAVAALLHRVRCHAAAGVRTRPFRSSCGQALAAWCCSSLFRDWPSRACRPNSRPGASCRCRRRRPPSSGTRSSPAPACCCWSASRPMPFPARPRCSRRKISCRSWRWSPASSPSACSCLACVRNTGSATRISGRACPGLFGRCLPSSWWQRWWPRLRAFPRSPATFCPHSSGPRC